MTGCTSARFMANNLLSLTTNTVTFSSEVPGFEGVNALDDFRSSVWRTAGNFTITTANQNLYINDGTNKTIAITPANYNGPAALCTQIATQLNAVSSGWSCTYDFALETYKFTITRSSSATLRLSQTTNAIWDSIGFITTVDLIGTSFPADEQRNHTNEFVIVDFGYQADVTFLGMVGDIAQNFKMSGDATVSIQGNNINDFTSPPLSLSINPDEKGAFLFLDLQGATDTRYRFWRIDIRDIFNVNGPYGVEVGNLYLGDSISMERNVQAGFRFVERDPSTKSESESGVLFFDKRTKYSSFSALEHFFVKKEDKDTLLKIFREVGTTNPFYFSLDPGLNISTKISDLTKFVVFDNEPEFPHEKTENFTIQFALREVV